MSNNSYQPTKTEEQAQYFNIDYDHKGRFCSYWHQINEIISLNPAKVLEVGVGNGFVSRYVKDKGVNIITSDIDSRLKPNVVGSIMVLPFTLR